MRPIIEALNLHTCEFIAEFDPEDCDPPTDPRATAHQSITIQTGRAAAREREREAQS
jgi:hypothetical protein